MRTQIRFLESALCATALKSFMTARLPKAASSRCLRCRQARGIINGNVPPPLIDDLDFASSSMPSAFPPLSTTSIIVRYHSRDLILSFIMSNLLSVHVMLIIIIMFMLILCNMLICHASLLYKLNLVYQFVMIYILVLIWKLSNYLTEVARG
jgi:hypothetical protein